MGDRQNHPALRARIVTVLTGLATAVTAVPAQAQGTEDVGDYCRRAEAALPHRPAGKEYAIALAGIQSCGEAAARALTAEWRRPPSDSAGLQDLATTSAAVTDRRLAGVTREIVQQPSRPRMERLAALATLVAQALPDTRVAYLETSRPATAGTPPVMLTELVHVPPRRPGQPVPTSPVEVLALLRKLTASDTDEVVRGVAAHLAEQICRKVK